MYIIIYYYIVLDGNAICENKDNIRIPPTPITIVTSTPLTTNPYKTMETGSKTNHKIIITHK